MASVNVTNWQASMRTAGALMDLQRTPYVVGTDLVTSNPKKTRQNELSGYDRAFLLNWPADTVKRIRVPSTSGSAYIVNGLELETSTVRYATGIIYGPTGIDFFDSTGIYPAYGFYNSGVYSGGDDLNYENATHYVNLYTPADLDGDGIDEDYWQVDTYTTTIAAGGNYTSTVSTAYLQAAPVTTGSACIYNGVTIDPGGFFSEPNNSVYASFTDVISANEHAETYATLLDTNAANFCMRASADSAHGLSALVSRSSANGLISTYSSPAGGGYIFSSREPTTDIASEYNHKTDTTCRWYYTPEDDCSDCWYAGKVVTVELTYKKAAISRTVSITTYGAGTITYNLGSWSTHSTVTQTLTIPSGLTKQAINAAFDIPTQDGYVVALDDIKLVSVA